MDRCLLNIQPNLCSAMEDYELENRDFSGLHYSGLIVGQARRGLRRGSEDLQDLYKLPHRLIEKKRRDRINECISQLKELLPDHLKQTTLGHLEKAVVLELTLKYMQELHALAEQQRQRIHSLQHGAGAGPTASAVNKQASGVEQGDSFKQGNSFKLGFHACMKQTLSYLQQHERCGARDDRYSRLLQHLQSKASSLGLAASSGDVKDEDVGNCVSVIQRNRSAEDLDGDGTEPKRREGGARRPKAIDADTAAAAGDDETDEPQRKKIKVEPGEQQPPPPPRSAGAAPQVPPFCVPLYFFPSPSGEAASVAAAYLPMLDPSALAGKKGWYPGPMPFFCPGFSVPTTVPPQGTAADCFGPLTPTSRGDETPDNKSDWLGSRSASPDSEDNSIE
ncbi:class E basic helix-loop-helix protein 41-like isoform X2 [Lethenteron reissneri]|uniref:class E basic helix-loop-helix protein 41-like isoform X2 n=1 Tax=Lethenteron reissneri TaxID=7753 RepID=UPI002AB7E77B|nr:class E basic helix-loop-helix protein 41-like isoform X2 [Lethenteron reissneri]